LRQEFDNQHSESCGLITSAFEAVLAWPQKQNEESTEASPEGYLEWARLWIALGCVLRECDSLMRSRIDQCLHQLETAGVPPLDAAASLLLLSQEGRPADVARSLADLNSNPTLRRFVGFLPWICNGLTDVVTASPLLLPTWLSNEEIQKALRASGFKVLGSEQETRKPRAALPKTPEKLLECVEFQRNEFLKRATKAGLPGRGVRVDTRSDWTAFICDLLDGDTILPSLEPLYVAAAALNLIGRPFFAGEPRSIIEAIESYEALAEWLRGEIQRASQQGPVEGTLEPTHHDRANSGFVVEHWRDMGIGIDGEKGILAFVPCPQRGDLVSLSTAKPLKLPGDRWRKVLDRLARSEDGKTARISDLVTELGYMKRPERSISAEQAQYDEHLCQTANRARVKLRNAMADLGRQLRKLMQIKDKTAVFEMGSNQTYQSAFRVGYLLKDENSRTHFTWGATS
jgi:hypothetical protein